MGNIKNYIRASIKTIHNQTERMIERQEKSEQLNDKLDKLLLAFNDDKITEEKYLKRSSDLMFAHIFGDGYFFDELDRRENEDISLSEMYEKLSVDEIQRLRPIDIAKLTRDYIDKKGLFEHERSETE